MVTFPIVNNNGTSREELLKINMDVMDHLRVTMQAMRIAAPHGRDFQTDRTGEAYPAARAEYFENLKKVSELLLYYEEICYSLAS